MAVQSAILATAWLHVS